MRKGRKTRNTDVENRILAVSEELFSSKGYDATGIDEIAKKASVTKSLIYYYFESKDKILEQLLERSIDDYIKQKELLSEQLTAINIDEISKHASRSFSALKEKSEIIKIAVIEALKSNKKDYSLFKMIDVSFSSLIPKMNEMGLNVRNETDSLITGFFFGFAPVVFAIILGEKWAEFHNIDTDEFNLKFSAKLKDFYVQYATEFLVKEEK
ncbi:MAG TPA: TetR/AcrR family transcriptional regulator [Anaerolineae bacterium]|nr:TetR/AcrR family transcriptional regulator [Anaerolineae bacterium]